MTVEPLRVVPDVPCLGCDFIASGMSDRAVAEAFMGHLEYVGQTADPLTDAHFEDARLHALITDRPFP